MEKPFCKGFKAAGISAGIKSSGKKDFGMIYSEVPAVVAGVFTRNKVKAAPVLLDQDRLPLNSCHGVVVNSGNANCCTGALGMEHAKKMAFSAAEILNLPEEKFMVSSTGVIGQTLPIDKITSATPTLVNGLSYEGFNDFAEAIMTTDRFPKLSFRQGSVDGKPYTILGVVKGAGMIRPDMATMLCFVCTDAKVDNPFLQEALNGSVDRSFNRITIDGDTSTNDTVLFFANGLSTAAIISSEEKRQFQSLLDDLLLDLAVQVVRGGEGVTKVAKISVQGALTREDAEKIAETISNSSLVKTALYGQDANWGRFLAAAGRAGAQFDPERADLFFDQVQLLDKGNYCGSDSEKKVSSILKQAEYTVTLNLNMGEESSWCLTSDFSEEFVRINADKRS